MQYRILGNTGMKVSQLCMGTMTFGREADKNASAEIFHACREAGINFFDCANVYVAGESEKILGELVAECRNEIVISSKVYGPMGSDINSRGSSRRNIMQAVEASLKRLNTDRIDLYFLHHFDSETPLEESLRALDDLIAQGKVLYAGVSNFAAWQVAKALGISAKEGWNSVKCIQPMYNLVKRQAEVEILPMALSEGLGVVSYSPLGGGLLSGKYAQHKEFASGRFATNAAYQKRYAEEWMHDTVQRFTDFAQQHGWHPVSLAVAWVNANPAITAPIIGARTIEQLEPSLQSVEIDVTAELYAQLSAFSPAPPPAHDRSEEAAR